MQVEGTMMTLVVIVETTYEYVVAVEKHRGLSMDWYCVECSVVRRPNIDV